jgi:hypothetical protein
MLLDLDSMEDDDSTDGHEDSVHSTDRDPVGQQQQQASESSRGTSSPQGQAPEPTLTLP